MNEQESARESERERVSERANKKASEISLSYASKRENERASAFLLFTCLIGSRRR